MNKEVPAEESTTEVENIEKAAPSIDQVEGPEVESRDEQQPRRGRPPKDIETVKRVPFSVSLSPKLVSRIIDQADEEGMSRSELVNEAVSFYLDMHKPGEKYIFAEERTLRQAIKEAFDEHKLTPKAETENPARDDDTEEGPREDTSKSKRKPTKQEDDEDRLRILGF